MKYPSRNCQVVNRTYGPDDTEESSEYDDEGNKIKLRTRGGQPVREIISEEEL